MHITPKLVKDTAKTLEDLAKAIPVLYNGNNAKEVEIACNSLVAGLEKLQADVDEFWPETHPANAALEARAITALGVGESDAVKKFKALWPVASDILDIVADAAPKEDYNVVRTLCDTIIAAGDELDRQLTAPVEGAVA